MSRVIATWWVLRLQVEGYSNLVWRTSCELDLCNQVAVDAFFTEEKPEYVFLAAARVGGIHANSSCPTEFIRDNIQIQTNVIDAAWRHGVDKLVFLGSSCSYPKLVAQPLREEYLFTGPLAPTNEWYAIAKIASIKMCQAYRQQYGFNAISLMPTNLYGANDNFDLETSYLLPVMIRMFHEAKERNGAQVQFWGTGKGFSIVELAQRVKETVGYKGSTVFDATKSDSTPRKLLDVSKSHSLEWLASIELADGIASAYSWYQKQTCDQ